MFMHAVWPISNDILTMLRRTSVERWVELVRSWVGAADRPTWVYKAEDTVTKFFKKVPNFIFYNMLGSAYGLVIW